MNNDTPNSRRNNIHPFRHNLPPLAPSPPLVARRPPSYEDVMVQVAGEIDQPNTNSQQQQQHLASTLDRYRSPERRASVLTEDGSRRIVRTNTLTTTPSAIGDTLGHNHDGSSISEINAGNEADFRLLSHGDLSDKSIHVRYSQYESDPRHRPYFLIIVTLVQLSVLIGELYINFLRTGSFSTFRSGVRGA